MKTVAAGVCFMLLASLVWAQQAGGPVNKAGSVEALRAEIEALKPAKLAWREIAWKSCLIEGLRQSRAQGKPMLLWVFIDRPADDGRC